MDEPRYDSSVKRYRILLIVWLLSDLLVFVASYALAYFLRVGWILSTDFPLKKYLLVTAAISPIWLLVLATTRTFGMTRKQSSIRNIAYIAYSCLVGTSLLTLVYYFTYATFFSRLLLLYAFAFSTLGTILWHICYRRFERAVLRCSPAAFPTLIVGVTRESRSLIAALNQPGSPLMPVAVLDGRGVKDTDIHGVPVRGKLNNLEEILDRCGITHLIQGSDMEQTINLLSACRNRGITFIVLPSVFGIVERDESVETLEGMPVTVVRPKSSVWSWFTQ